NTGCLRSPSSVHSLYLTSTTSVGSTQVCPLSGGAGPSNGGFARTLCSRTALTSLSCAAVNPLPARPVYTSFPFSYAPRSSAPNPEQGLALLERQRPDVVALEREQIEQVQHRRRLDRAAPHIGHPGHLGAVLESLEARPAGLIRHDQLAVQDESLIGQRRQGAGDLG